MKDARPSEAERHCQAKHVPREDWRMCPHLTDFKTRRSASDSIDVNPWEVFIDECIESDAHIGTRW